MHMLCVERILDLKSILTETFKINRAYVDIVDVLTYITKVLDPHHKGNPILSTGYREVSAIHWAYISMWEVDSKQINKNKLPLKKKTTGGTIKGKRNLFRRASDRGFVWGEAIWIAGKERVFFSLSIQLELQLRPCKPHFKRQIRNRKGYVLFTRSYMTWKPPYKNIDLITH